MSNSKLIEKVKKSLEEVGGPVTFIPIEQPNYLNYVEMAIYLSSIKVIPSKRLTPTQVRIIAELIRETSQNGLILNNRARYGKFVQNLINKGIVKTGNSFSTHKTMLINQGFIMGNVLHSTLEINNDIYEPIKTGKIVICLTNESLK